MPVMVMDATTCRGARLLRPRRRAQDQIGFLLAKLLGEVPALIVWPLHRLGMS